MNQAVGGLERVIPFQILDYRILGNTVGVFAIAFLSFLLFLIAFKITQSVILYRLKIVAKKTKTDIDDTLIEIVQKIRPPFYFFLSFYFSLRILYIPEFGWKILNAILLFWIVYLVITAIQILIDYVAKKTLQSDNESETRSAISLVSISSKVILWSIGLLLVMGNLGINVTSLIAGLGIGGVAIAFALQNILADLFSSFAIYLDKPFRVGDFIAVGTDKGTVERIGIKTTRLTSLQGEELVISNQELTSARVQNFKNMIDRRIVFSFGVIYETPNRLLKRVPEIITEIIKDVDKARLDRVHFLSFGDSSLNFEVVYYVNSREYIDYADTQQEINFKIRDVFEREGIEMAYPTSTIYMAKSNG